MKTLTILWAAVAALLLSFSISAPAAYAEAVGINAAGFAGRVGASTGPLARPWGTGKQFSTYESYRGNTAGSRARAIRNGYCWATCRGPEVDLSLDDIPVPAGTHVDRQYVIPSTTPQANNGKALYHFANGRGVEVLRPHDPDIDGYDPGRLSDRQWSGQD